MYRASLHCTETRRLIWGFARKKDAATTISRHQQHQRVL